MKSPLKIALIYFFLGISWILIGDYLSLSFLKENGLINYRMLQTLKGVTYIILTSLLLYYLIQLHFKEVYKKNRKLKASNEILEQYSFITSHNLRAPIAQIIGLTNLIKMADNEEDFYQNLNYLQQAAHNMDLIIHDLNSILSIRTRGNLAYEKINLRRFSRLVLSELPGDYKNKVDELTFDIEKDEEIYTNRGFLASILQNLFMFAINCRSLHEPLKIEISKRVRNNFYVIAITDNGTGLDMDLVGEKIFKPYQQVHHNQINHELGLCLVKAHVEALDGFIEVKSQKPEGTSFFLYLPVYP